MTTLRVEDEAVLPHALPLVFAAAADPFKQLEWDPLTLRRVEQLTDGPLGLGARYRGTFKDLGVVEYEFAEYEVDRRFVHRSRIPMGVMLHTFAFEPVAEGTRLTQVGVLETNLMGTIGSPVVRRTLQHRFRSTAARIDRYLRRDAPDPG
jgi:hypothetical protein